MKSLHQSVDMLHGPLTGKLIAFTLPIAFSSMLQQLFNAADTSVVGLFADANALASVGTNGEIVAFLVTLSSGLSVGINVLIARYIGSNQKEYISGALHTGLLFALLSGICLAVFGQFLSRPLLIAINTPSNILNSAVIYLRLYFCSCPFLMFYDFGSAILRAKGDSRRPFLILTISGIFNVLLNLFFVVVCKMGVTGVAIATDLSTLFSACMILFSMKVETDEFHVSLSQIHMQKDDLLSMLSVGIPSAIQGAVFCFANIFVQASVNSFGSVATAGSTIAMNFEYFGYYMITAFGQAATTFTSQNFAAGSLQRCRKILISRLLCSLFFCSAIIIPLTVWKELFCRFFSSDADVIQSACLRISLILFFEPVCCLYEIPAGFLRGIGHSTLPAVLTVVGTCILRIIWIFTVFSRIHTLESLFVVFPVSWAVTIILIWSSFFHHAVITRY